MHMVYFYAGGVVALLGCAVALLRTYCESAGCMGIAVLWLIWAASFGLWLLFGLVVLARAKRSKASVRPLQAAVLGQLALGAPLVVYWATRNAA